MIAQPSIETDDLLRRVRPEISQLKPYAHAFSTDALKEKYGLERVIKLASNENPLGAPPLAQLAFMDQAAAYSRYPEADNNGLIQAIAETLDVDPACVVVGNGSDEIIDLLVRVKPRPGKDHVLAFDPCFDVYKIQSQLCGVEFRQVPLNTDFSHALARLLAQVNEDTALIFLTSPDNPTGQVLDPGEVETFAGMLPPATFLVMDEAYIEFTDTPTKQSVLSRLNSLPNVGIMRTFSKAYGLAGLRLGYGIFPAWLAELLRRTQIVFSVNMASQQAGIAALADKVHLEETRQLTMDGRKYLYDALKEMQCAPLPSQANFLMFKPPMPADDFFQKMLTKGIILRSLASAGLPDYIRVSVGTMEENRLFVEVLINILS